MKTPIRTFLLLLALGSVFAGNDLCAQWKMIAPNKVIPFPGFPFPSYGAIHYKDGVLWAGWEDLWRSNDSGKTWQQSIINLSANDIITDITFYDKINGLVSTLNKGIFITSDGGQTWKLSLPTTSPSSVLNIAFDGSINIFHAITGDGKFYTSLNGGTSWANSRPGVDFGICFTIAKDKNIYALTTKDDINGEIATISVSKDLGVTWRITPGAPDGDSYTICADSCDEKRIYLASEDHESSVFPLDLSQLFTSTTAGNNWTSEISFPTFYFAGGMTCTINAIYASSLKSGLYRSTDQGITWKNISGPSSMAFDSRNITCVNDNIVFALDDQGSIWETMNSGGDSLNSATLGNNDLVLSQNSLFSNDSLIVCDTSISSFFSIQPKGCIPPTLIKIELLGSDSLSYTTTPLAGDSIGVNFLPVFDSLNNAQLVLSLSDGRQKIISLAGFGIPRTPLALATQDQTLDSLGGSTAIPVILNGLRKPEDITLIIHYDTVLNYNGSFSSLSSGKKLDIAGEQWKGRSKLKIIGAIPNSTLGYAFFDVFNDSVPIQHVTFDSVTVLSALNGCQYISSGTATSTVTPLSGCGVATISKFLHYGRLPDLRIVPNPASGDAQVTTTMDLGEVNIDIYDMLGALRGSAILTISKNSPAKLLLPLSNGVYEVRVKSILGSFDLQVVVNR